MLSLIKKYGLILMIICLTACNGGSSSGGSSNSNPPTPATPQVSMDPPAGGVANGANNVSLTPTLVLKFANPMLTNTINANTIQLYPTASSNIQHTTTINDVVLSNFTASNDNTVFTFTPVTPLTAGIQYSLVIGNGAQTSDGTVVSGQFSFTTGNYAIPTVALLNPGNNSTGISLSPSIQLQFNEAVQNVTPSNITLHEESAGGIGIAISSITAGANNTYTFSPVESLNQQTSYYVVINSQIHDNGGDALTPITFKFTTGDFTIPVASIITPSNNATNVSVNPSIQIHFSKAVENVNTANITLHVGSIYGPTAGIESITVGANNTYSITPSVTLNQLTTYYLALTDGITDTNGNSLAFTSFSFTTGEFTAPTVVMLNPTNNATKVNYGSGNFSIILQFSKPVQNVTESTVVICGGSPFCGTVQISDIIQQANNIYSISIYNSYLNPQTQYTITLGNGITDNYGNALIPATFNFTTDLEITNIQNIAFNGKYAYIMNLTNTVTKCDIQDDNGNLSNCQPATQNVLGAGSGIAFNDGYAYISSSMPADNSVTSCTVDNANGNLTLCSAIVGDYFGARDIGIYKSNAYIVSSSDNQVIQCGLGNIGLLDNCTVTGSGFNYPSGIAFANSYAYITNFGSGIIESASISQCSINSNGKFGSCNKTGSAFDYPTKIAVNGNYAYITNYTSSIITQCSINTTNGNLTNCTTINNSLINFPLGIQFNNGYAYIAETGNRTITKCTVNNSNGSFSNCTTM